LGKAMLARAPAHSRAKVASGSVFAAVKIIWQALGMVHRYVHATYLYACYIPICMLHTYMLACYIPICSHATYLYACYIPICSHATVHTYILASYIPISSHKIKFHVFVFMVAAMEWLREMHGKRSRMSTGRMSTRRMSTSHHPLHHTAVYPHLCMRALLCACPALRMQTAWQAGIKRWWGGCIATHSYGVSQLIH